MFALAALVGIGGGAAAAGLEWGLHHGSELLVGRFTYLGGPGTFHFEWGVLLLPAAGGLLSGLVVLCLCPGAKGHGTDVVTRAFHRNLGALPLRAPLVKAAASVGVISCGGSAGPEGPIAALGAALGSTVGHLFGVTPRERRLLLVAGCAAGIGAIFRCPLGGALFAAAILYREPEFESEAIVPGFIASVVGYSTFMAFQGFGTHLLPDADRLAFATPVELAPYALLGLACGGLSIFFYMCFRGVERLVPLSRLPVWLAPAVGGLATGALACVLPQIMDGRYLFVRNAMDGSLFSAGPTHDWWWWARLFAAVALFKCMATAFTVGSGASGGMLGPGVFIGGVVGACVGAALEALYPGTFPESLRKSLIPVGMGGVLAASMRTPLAAIVMATEMAGSYGLIVPSMLVCIVAYVIGRRWGLNREQVRSVTESPAHASDAIVHVLESRSVTSAMEKHWSLVVPPNATLSEMVRRMLPGTRPVFAVVRDRRLEGLIRVPDLDRFMREPNLGEAVIAADMMAPARTAVHPDDDLYHAMHVFRRHPFDVIPVVSRDNQSQWLGMLSRQRVFEIVERHINDLYRSALAEHSGLAAIEQEGQLAQLLMGLQAAPRDRIQRLPVPPEVVGQSLRQADFAQRFGAQVIAIENPDGAVRSPPDLDAPLAGDQTLVAIVRDSAEPAEVEPSLQPPQ
jgi:CIC family chloride channel protein